MGGLGSGRKRQHTCIDDCLVLDTAWLRKRKILGQPLEIFSIEWKHWTETNFIKRKEHCNKVSAYYRHSEHPTLRLYYQTVMSFEDGRASQEYSHEETIKLESTPCNYGGCRWWFIAPCCGRRVRVLYINQKMGDIQRMTPQCRNCLELHYASQMASYIEKHKTYERYLLANYGLWWASHRYDYELKAHYLKMTPELWALRMKSVIDWNLHLLKEVIKCDLMIYRSDVRNLRSLRSEEDRRLYLAHMQKRKVDSLALVKVLQQCIAYERLIYEVNTAAMPDSLFELYEQITAFTKDIADMDSHQAQEQAQEEETPAPPVPAPAQVEAMEQKIISLEALLKQVNKVELKKAA